MIKNGRAYTICDNGEPDEALLTDLSVDEVCAVGKWIQDNIRGSVNVCVRTSYSLKHKLEEDTRIYMTNNAFKDAMLLAGYYPEDPDELNWRWRISYIPEEDKNPNPFLKWVLLMYDGDWDNMPKSIFVKGLCNDEDFPPFAEHDIMRKYMESVNPDDGVIDAFEEYWKEYCEAHPA